jgi:hypothetical protein
MRSTTARTLIMVAGGLIASACSGPSVHVTTATAPNAVLAGRHTFRLLDVPQRRNGISTPDDPMLTNSMTNEVLREDITRAFESRGYAPSGDTPDLAVAYYASARDKLDLQTWDYGYTWRGWPRQYVDVNEYTQGTVIVDVVDPTTKTLLWRGKGVAQVSDSPATYEKELGKTVNAILSKFPSAL